MSGGNELFFLAIHLHIKVFICASYLLILITNVRM